MEFQKRRVGRTALEVTLFGLGGATFAGNMAKTGDGDARMVIVDAYDSGVRYFDTAPFYGYGRSEHLVGDVLRDRTGWVLSTKVGRRLRPMTKPRAKDDPWERPLPFEIWYDYTYDGAMRSFEDSIQRLGVDHIDIAYIHDIDTYTHGKDIQPGMFKTAMDGAYRALDRLRGEGAVKAIGIGVNEARPIADALAYGTWDVFLLAGRYTLLEQAPLADLFPALEKHGATVVVGGPFNSGILVGRDLWNYSRAPAEVIDRVKAIARVCDAHKVPLPSAALRFLTAHPLVSSIIPGPRNCDELNQIFDWWSQEIPASLWSDLKNEKLIAAEAPVPA
jgi:D-threo-aldose 1-dehydrogenase